MPKKILNKPSFESLLPEINKLIEQRRSKWTLKGVTWLDYDDVAQILRIHIFEKWFQYDPKKPLAHWINRIISNQIINLRRNLYYSYAKPCLKCAHNEGGDLCAFTPSNKQCSECPFFRKWEKTKKRAHDLKLPVSTESHINEVSEMPHEHYNIEEEIIIFHKEMIKRLKPIEKKIYILLYINELAEAAVVKELGWVSNEKYRSSGYGSLSRYKKIILQKAKKLKDEIDLF